MNETLDYFNSVQYNEFDIDIFTLMKFSPITPADVDFHCLNNEILRQLDRKG